MEAVASFWDSVEGTANLKAGFLGFPKSGKTYTMMLLSILVHKMFGGQPIAFFDTEGGSTYIKDVVKFFTGSYPLVKRARSFDDMMEWGKQVQAVGAIGNVDSITHPWRELCDSYLFQKNEALVRAGKSAVRRLSFEDWNVLKPTWGAWTDFYLSSPLHLLIAGRAGWDYEYQVNEETDKKELVKTGVKMKTEGEFGFEPSLLIEMEREQERSGESPRIVRRATVLGDRFQILDGKTFLFPSSDDPAKDLDAVAAAFEPHLLRLTPGASSPVETKNQTEFGVDHTGDAAWTREKREREILAEEIQGEMVAAYPGQSAAEKKEKADLLLQVFQTRSWTAVENMRSEQLRTGLAAMRGILLSRLQAKTPEVANA